MLEEMRHMTIMFSLFICERCLRNYSNPVAVVVEFNAPLSHKSCSRLQPSSIGPCPAMSQVTVSSLPTSVLHNSILLTLEHSSVRRAAALETGPLPPQDLKFGTVCCPISDCVECHMASSGSYWRQFYFDCEATAQCALFLSVPNRNIFTTYKLRKSTECITAVVSSWQWWWTVWLQLSEQMNSRSCTDTPPSVTIMSPSNQTVRAKIYNLHAQGAQTTYLHKRTNGTDPAINWELPAFTVV